MRKITEPVSVRRANAWGVDQDIITQTFEIEPQDIGAERPHLHGYNYRAYKIGKRDVGRNIEVLSDGKGWTCWSFLT